MNADHDLEAGDALGEQAEIILRGVRVRWSSHGAADGPAVLFLHGLGRGLAQWAPIVDRLGRERRTLAIEVTSGGGHELATPERTPRSLEDLAEVVLDFIASLSLGRVALVGQSIGAAAALIAAADRPEFVERLVLIAPPLRRRPPTFAERVVATRLPTGQWLRRALASRAIAGHGGRLEQPLREHEIALLRALIAPATTRALEARLPRVRCPAMLVLGRADELHPASHGPRLARELCGARLEVVESGPAPDLDLPDTLAALVDDFLADEATGPDEARPRSAAPRAGIATPWSAGRDGSGRP
jgi:pimeloyl-ACP methyl ester carboxylesterase